MESSEKAGMSVVACTIPQWDIEGFLRYVKPVWKRKGWGKNGEYPLSAEELQQRTDEINQWILAQKGGG